MPGTEPLPTAGSSIPGRGRLAWLFCGLMVGLLLSELDSTIFSTALPTIVGELDGVEKMLWVTTAYVLAATIVMPVYGKLGDLIGRRGLFVGALIVFVVGSVIGALAPDMSWLVAGRAVQGLGGGGLLILVQAIIADVIPARERAPYLSVVGAVFALSAVLGPILGGWLTEGVGWRWALWINVPLGGLAIACAATLLPRSPARPGRTPFDFWGFTALAAGVTALVLLSAWGGTRYPWSSPVVLLLVGTAVAAGLGFVAAERRASEPLIGLHLFGQRNFTVATLAGLVMAVAMFGTIGYLPTYLQMVNGLGAMHAGLMMLTLVAGIALTTVGAAQLVRRTGRYRALPVLGAALVAVALALMSTLTPTTGLWVTGSYLFLFGAGMGCALEILLLVVQNSAPNAQVGTATAATSFFRELGVSLGTAVVGTLFTRRLVTLLSERLPQHAAGAVEAHTLTPEGVRLLPEAVQASIASAYNDALTPVFLLLVPLMLLSVVALLLIQAVPLATTVEEAEPFRTVPSRTLAESR